MNLLISANRFDEVSQLAEMSQYLKNTARGCCGGQEKSFNDDIIRVFVVWFIILPRRSSRGFLFSAHLFPSALAFYLQKHPKSAWSEPLRTHRNQNPWLSLVITVCLKKGRTAQNSRKRPFVIKQPRLFPCTCWGIFLSLCGQRGRPTLPTIQICLDITILFYYFYCNITSQSPKYTSEGRLACN